MLTLIAILATLTTATPAEDPCAALLADAPSLEGLAVEMAVECQRERARERLARNVVLHRQPRPVRSWGFAEMNRAPELPAELASIGTQASPFAVGDADPFEEGR